MVDSETRGRHVRHAAPRTSSPSSATSSATSSASRPSGYQLPRIDEGGQKVFVQGDDAANYRADRYVRHARGGHVVAKRVGIGLLAVLVLFAAALGTSGVLMARAASGMSGDASSLKRELLGGDYAAAQTTAASLADAASALASHAKNPVWALASHLPLVGSGAQTLRVAARTADDVCAGLVVPMVDRLAQSGTGAVVDGEGRLNADALQICLEQMGAANAVLSADRQASEALRPSMIYPVDKGRRVLRGVLQAADKVATVSPELASRIHWLLGAEGEGRTYLIVAQNNVELRARGGYAGSMGPMYVQDGKLSTGEFVAGTSVGRFDSGMRPVGDGSADPPAISDEEAAVFGKRVVLVPCEYGYNPSFPVASERWKYVWSLAHYENADGVIALDPVFLQTLLGLFGSVVTADGTVVDGSNAARLLMYDTYRSRSSQEQDQLFSEVASLAFGQATSSLNTVDMVDFAEAIWRAGADGRLNVWATDASVQHALEHMGFGGTLGHDASRPVLGVYFNDDVWGKMSWYFSSDTSIGPAQRNADGSASYQCVTTLKNNITEGEVADLPKYVSGHSPWCADPQTLVMWVHLFAPEGGTISNVTAQGSFVDPATITGAHTPLFAHLEGQQMNHGSYQGLDVWYGMTTMKAGQTVTVSYTVTTSPQATQRLELDTTATAQEAAGW